MCQTSQQQQVEMSREGRRFYLRTPYGHAVVPLLRSLGAKWDPESKRWWVGSAKEDAARRAVTESGSEKAKEDAAKEKKVIGKAAYKGRSYYVEWAGETKHGPAAKLTTLDGKIEFWAPTVDRGDGKETAAITKRYREPMSLGKIQRFIERAKEDSASNGGSRPDRGDPGCYECRSLGRMCDRCRFDEYDC